MSIEEKRSGIEDAILLALHSARSGRIMRSVEKHKGGWRLERTEMARFCGPDMFPRSCYTFDLADGGQRLFSADWGDLVVDPVKAIGARIEEMLLCDDGTLKWSGIAPMSRPRGLAAITNHPASWFSFHFRHIGRDGRQIKYVKRPFCIAGGDVVMLKPLGWSGFDPELDRSEIRDQVTMLLSMFEDARRSSSFLATVKEGVELMFPVGQKAYKDFFALRDGPNNTPTGRKNPILHFCSKHLRRVSSEKSVPVAQHLRGTETLHIGPMSLTIEANDGYGRWVEP